MGVGDRVRLTISARLRNILEMPKGIGVLKVIDRTREPPALLIDFGDMWVYTSALLESEVRVVEPAQP